MYKSKEPEVMLNQDGEDRALIASKYKVAFHREKITKYISDGRIFPVTLELDLTSRCNNKCPDCPSGRAVNSDNLSVEFIDRLFSLLSFETRGLLLTGGEATLSPLFPSTVNKAKEKGFKNIAVVSNGSRLEDPVVADALLEHVTVLRVSMYEMNQSVCDHLSKVLSGIESLRRKIDIDRSKLEIGVSILTQSDKLGDLEKMVNGALSSGVHWVYFHPFCSKWNIGSPEIVEQGTIEEEIRRLQSEYRDRIGIYYPEERYSNDPVHYSGYHGANFLMVVGADGKNYLGAETKYDPSMIIADLNNNLSENFLWNHKRLDNILKVTSSGFKAIKSRHRGSLYSSLIEELKGTGIDIGLEKKEEGKYKYPHIL